MNLLMEQAKDILRRIGEENQLEVTVSKRKWKRIEAIELVRTRRAEGRQDLAFSSRPFVLTGLPIRRLPKDVLEYARQNGNFFLSIIGHPQKGIPFGQDRLIPIWVTSLALSQNSRIIRFNAASQLLETFGLPKDGKTYRRLVEGFERIFWATIAFGTDEQTQGATVIRRARFNFFDKMQIWYSRNVDQRVLPGDFENVIELSDQFWQEIKAHPIPVDLNVVRALADSPGNLDFYVWLVWRCWTARREARVPLFGPGGLILQLGVSERIEQRQFRRQVRDWLQITQKLWPGCPAVLTTDTNGLIVKPGKAIHGPK